MNKIKNMIWFVMLGLYFSCSSSGSAPQKSTAYKVDYEEDLSIYRTAYAYKAEDAVTTPVEKPVSTTQPEQTINVNADLSVTSEINNFLDEVAEKNEEVEAIPGFTIQVFKNVSREAAEQARRRVYYVLPDARPELTFVSPNYIVKVGQYVERLEAQKTYSLLKKEFPNAIVTPDRIRINN